MLRSPCANTNSSSKCSEAPLKTLVPSSTKTWVLWRIAWLKHVLCTSKWRNKRTLSWSSQGSVDARKAQSSEARTRMTTSWGIKSSTIWRCSESRTTNWALSLSWVTKLTPRYRMRTETCRINAKCSSSFSIMTRNFRSTSTDRRRKCSIWNARPTAPRSFSWV